MDKINSQTIKKANNIIFEEYGIYSSYVTLARIKYNPEYKGNKKLMKAIDRVFSVINNIK